MAEVCEKCGEALDVGSWPWCKGGHSKGVNVVLGDDSYIGGKVLRNVAHENITVYSRSEEKRVLKQHGVEPFVRHVGEQGSDKSPHTTRWI